MTPEEKKGTVLLAFTYGILFLIIAIPTLICGCNMGFQNTCALYWIEDVELANVQIQQKTCYSCTYSSVRCNTYSCGSGKRPKTCERCSTVCLQTTPIPCFKTLVTAVRKDNKESNCHWESSDTEVSWADSVSDSLKNWKSPGITRHNWTVEELDEINNGTSPQTVCTQGNNLYVADIDPSSSGCGSSCCSYNSEANPLETRLYVSKENKKCTYPQGAAIVMIGTVGLVFSIMSGVLFALSLYYCSLKKQFN